MAVSFLEFLERGSITITKLVILNILKWFLWLLCSITFVMLTITQKDIKYRMDIDRGSLCENILLGGSVFNLFDKLKNKKQHFFARLAFLKRYRGSNVVVVYLHKTDSNGHESIRQCQRSPNPFNRYFGSRSRLLTAYMPY